MPSQRRLGDAPDNIGGNSPRKRDADAQPNAELNPWAAAGTASSVVDSC